LQENKSVVAAQHYHYIPTTPAGTILFRVPPAGITKGDIMDKSTIHPDFSAIESHIRRARIERSAYLAQLVVRGIKAGARGLRAAKQSLEANFHAVMHRTISSDAAARRFVPRY
jgi:hypothetical protein